ncbi:hypothetical protein IKF89_01330 [Candidatus Saccharibacteria bacterium]|nr:hypothetical protein [Candidatus Saccharibacteria bacterium]
MKKVFYSLVAMVIGGMMLMAPAMARCTQDQLDSGCVSTSILANGCSCDDGSGSETKRILQLVVTIMTMGVGILAVLGITIVGIQYLTAGGSEEKTRKAKRRMFEIVIGLVAYVIIYAVLHWLIPDFSVSF